MTRAVPWVPPQWPSCSEGGDDLPDGPDDAAEHPVALFHQQVEDALAVEAQALTMPSGHVAPGCVLPTCGSGHHQVAARLLCGGRSVAAVPMNGSQCSITGESYGSDVSNRHPPGHSADREDQRR